MNVAFGRVEEGVMIPALLRAAPQAREVLDRHGLHGCGGRWGPAESLGSFARAHDVPVDLLLAEIRDRLAGGPAQSQPTDPAPGLADTIYRPFVQAAILIALTLGATWGAYLLLRIGFGGSFAAAGLHEVNAHGHAQIFGWVGLFVMGIAYQALPRFKHASLPHPRLAHLSLWLMLAGLAARSVLQPLAPAHPGLFVPAVLASGLEVAAVGLFAWIVVRILHAGAGTRSALDAYVLLRRRLVCRAGGRRERLPGGDLAGDRGGPGRPRRHLAAGPARRADPRLRPADGPRLQPAPAAPGLRPAGPAPRALLALACLNAAVVGEAVGLVLMRLHGTAWGALWYASVLLLTAAAAYLVSGWRLLSAPIEPERGVKFLRAAFVWLFVSLAMLVLLPAYQHGLLPLLAPEAGAARVGFSHAYYGATRHAITVGFISLAIVGVAARIVPTLNGIDPRALTRLWAPFLLLNVGCAIRVLGQTATDLTPTAFPVAGLSGLLEVTGLALWGVHLWAVMAGRYSGEPAADEARPLDGAITPDHHVGDVLDRHPGLLPAFVRHGFSPLQNPLLRATVARRVSLGRACALLGVDVQAFVTALNAERGGQPAPGNESSHSTEPGVPSVQPTDILKSEHRVIEQVLNCLEVLAGRAAAGALDEAAARQALDFFRTFADGCHHHKEEEHLFPALEARGLPRQGGPTGVMLAEHDEGRAHIRALTEALDGHDAGGFAEHARAYVHLLRGHIAREDGVLFPLADRALGEPEQRALLAAFDDVENRELHAGTHERYLRLADELARHLGVVSPTASAGGHAGCGGCGCHAGHH